MSNKTMDEQPETSPELEAKPPEQDKAAEYYDQLLRLKAEFENFRKRAEREKSESRAWGKQQVLMELISLVDVFQQALIQAHSATDLKQVVQGVDMLHKSFGQFLKREGLEAIEVMGKPFDPQTAEAIEQVEVDEDLVGTVLAELQKGYLFQGRVLRPSRVRVGVARKTAAEKQEDA
jgi:molecular chaperone GrpE